jgi:RNA polymerase sigma-70 factor (ECF subfamily)
VAEEAASERDWIVRARGGDAAAFRALVARHDRALVELATRLLGDADEAHDVRQQAWLRIWQALPRFDGRSEFRTWSWQVVVHLCRDRQRWRTRRVQRATVAIEAAEVRELAAPDCAPDAALLNEERTAQVRAALAALPDDERECLVLRHYHDLAPAEIAAVVGRPRTTVQSCLARALLKLHQRLRPTLEETDGLPRSRSANRVGGA